MSIPQPSKEAIDESYSKIIKKDFNVMNNDDLMSHLKSYHDEFKERQPGLYDYIKDVCNGHEKMLDGKIYIPQFVLYMIIAIDSLYIQKEMDDIGKLFDGEK